MSKEYDELKKMIDDLKKENSDLRNDLNRYTDNSRIKYGWVDINMPEWARGTISKMLRKGYLKGDETGNLRLSDDMLRLFVTNDRAEFYGS